MNLISVFFLVYHELPFIRYGRIDNVDTISVINAVCKLHLYI